VAETAEYSQGGGAESSLRPLRGWEVQPGDPGLPRLHWRGAADAEEGGGASEWELGGGEREKRRGDRGALAVLTDTLLLSLG